MLIKQEIINLFDSKPELTQRNLQIIACAGSGKTEFISSRIAYLIYKKIVKPENIVAFTFTEKAAEELKFRIRSKIRELVGHQPDIGDIYIGTIHSFCLELLKEYSSGFRGFDVLEEGKRYAFVSSIRNDLDYVKLKEWLYSDGFKKSYGETEQSWILNTFIRGIDIVKEELKKPEKISDSQPFIDAFNKYNKILGEKHFLDFSSMMSIAVNEFENNKEFREMVRNKYTYITVDEYQDINPIQERLIQLLIGNMGNICVVGDDDQSIYQWRGSTVENILTFRNRYKDIYTYPLDKNYRSADRIIDLSNDLIKKNKKRLQKSMYPTNSRNEHGDIYKLRFETQEEEVKFIVERIIKLIGTKWIEKNGTVRGISYSDIAIFFRSVRYEAKPYLEALDKAHIPYAVSGIGGLFETEEIDIIFNIFSYLGNFGKIWLSLENKNKVPDEDFVYNSAQKIFSLLSKKDFIKQLKQLKIELKRKGRISLQRLYADILNMLGVSEDSFHNDKNEVIRYNLGRLSQSISDYEGTRTYCTYKDIERFCWFIVHYAESSYDAGAGEDPTRVINAVQVMTLHATKGLGFPVVFMPYCVQKKPRQTSPGFLNPKRFNFIRYCGSEEDERRLFYVGLTRAKKFLFVTTAKNPGPKKRKREPSIFFNELNDKHCIIKPILDPTKRNKTKPQPSTEDYRFPTNYSELSDYIRCEYDYKMRYIYGFNPIIVQALGYGKQIHNILSILHKLAENGKIPSHQVAVELLKRHFYLRYAAEKQQEKLTRSALKSILSYLNLWREDFILSLKSERPFEMDFDNALISGTIDLLKRKTVNENILEIIDFKTGNERKLDEELHLQVQLYTIAAREALNLNVEKAHVHFLDDEKQKRVEILITPKQLELARQTISDAIKGVTTRRFRRNPRNIKTCTGCDWIKICPKKKN